MSDQIKVQVRHLTKKFGDLLVLDDVSFDVMDGDLLCVVGPTGCGKTTFLNSLVNIYDITSGEILLDGQKVNTKKQNIAYIFQGNSTMPWLTVEENVGFGLPHKPLSDAEKTEPQEKSWQKLFPAASGHLFWFISINPAVSGLIPLKAAAAESSAACQIKRFI